MLILRRKTLSENTAAALIQQFPQLAVASSRGVFMDTINLFASLNTENRESKIVNDAVSYHLLRPCSCKSNKHR
jgi:hypothetical protein